SSDDNSALAVAFLVPKSWNARENTTITYTDTYQPNVVKTMSIIPIEVSPKNRQGMTWDEALKLLYGVGSNVLDEMEWVTFQTDEVYEVKNGDKQSAKITVVTKVGPDNLRFKLGYLINVASDGLTESRLVGTPEEFRKFGETDCIEVVDGEGDLMDFCELHFNMMTPSNATKEDILTIKFQGEAGANDLDGIAEIYLVAKATTAGGDYAVSEKSAKTRMVKESGKTYGLTFWPAAYFGIPDNEEILRIEYYFTNADGSKSVLQTYDNGDPDTWFIKTITCK
ncbi:MAG: DUF4961 domain-containing protein, partial [Proteiniphilum sp.]|nr:DUF4961 domain-containing protein [Proteiniphilum sp.]